MLAHQLYYTSCERGVLGASGFQILACNNEITAQERKEIQPLLAYSPAAHLPLRPTEKELAQFPVHRGHTWLTTGRQVVFQSVYRGAGLGGRMGNFFGHALIFDGSPLPASPAQREWSGVLVREARDVEAHVAATGDTSLAPLTIDVACLPCAAGLETKVLAAWLSEDDRLSRASGLLRLLLERNANPAARNLILMGPEEVTRPWLAILQMSLPAAWRTLASYGTYFMELGKAPVAIACHPTPSGNAAVNFTLQRTSNVIQLAGATDWPPGNAEIADWLAQRWKNLVEFPDSEVEFEAEAMHYRAPSSEAQFCGAIAWLLPRVGEGITQRQTDFVRRCAHPAGWKTFWRKMKSADIIIHEHACAMIDFLVAAKGDAVLESFAWTELVALPQTVLGRPGHSTQDCTALAGAIATAAGSRLPELLEALWREGFLERLEEDTVEGQGNAWIGHLLDWAWACKPGSVRPEVIASLMALFAVARPKVGVDISSRWLVTMPAAWQPQLGRVLLKSSNVEDLARWLIACKGKESPAILIEWGHAGADKDDKKAFADWIKLVTGMALAGVSPADGAQFYKRWTSLPGSVRPEIRSAMFSGFAGTQQDPFKISAACIDFIESSIKQRLPVSGITSVLGTLNASLPLDGRYKLSLKRLTKILACLSPPEAPTAAEASALKACWVLASFEKGDAVASVRQSLTQIEAWLQGSAGARGPGWMRAVGRAMSSSRRPASEHSYLLEVTSRLDRKGPNYYLEGALPQMAGSVAILSSVVGDTLPDAIKFQVARTLKLFWAAASHSKRRKLSRLVSTLPPANREPSLAWIASLPTPPGIVARLLSKIRKKQSDVR